MLKCGMAPDSVGFNVSVALGGVLTGVLGAIFTYRIQSKKVQTDYWAKLQTAQTAFQQEIRADLERVKAERDTLKQEVTDIKAERKTLTVEIETLRQEIKTLLAQNERLVLEKIEWMQKTAGMQMLLQRALRGSPFDSNTSLADWLRAELDRLGVEEVSDEHA